MVKIFSLVLASEDEYQENDGDVSPGAGKLSKKNHLDEKVRFFIGRVVDIVSYLLRYAMHR